MKEREPFKRLNVEELRKKRAIEEAMNDFMLKADLEINRAVVEVVNELGYSAKEDMPLEETQELASKMKADGVEVSVRTSQEGKTYTAEVVVIQVSRALEFNLEG